MIYGAVYLCICFGVLSIQIEYQHEVGGFFGGFFTHAPKESVTVDTVQHTLQCISLSLYDVPM